MSFAYKDVSYFYGRNKNGAVLFDVFVDWVALVFVYTTTFMIVVLNLNFEVFTIYFSASRK